jgi:hypothetical protein
MLPVDDPRRPPAAAPCARRAGYTNKYRRWRDRDGTAHGGSECCAGDASKKVPRKWRVRYLGVGVVESTRKAAHRRQLDLAVEHIPTMIHEQSGATMGQHYIRAATAMRRR